MTEKQINKLIKAEKNDYYRKWRAANAEKVKQHKATYWKKKALQRLANEITNEHTK